MKLWPDRHQGHHMSDSANLNGSGNDTLHYLQDIPDSLRKPLLAAFNEIVKNFREGRWEPSELNGGKLCEVVYTIVRGVVDGHFPAKPGKPKDMVASCRALESENQKFGRSLRI